MGQGETNSQGSEGPRKPHNMTDGSLWIPTSPSSPSQAVVEGPQRPHPRPSALTTPTVLHIKERRPYHKSPFDSWDACCTSLEAQGHTPVLTSVAPSWPHRCVPSSRSSRAQPGVLGGPPCLPVPLFVLLLPERLPGQEETLFAVPSKLQKLKYLVGGTKLRESSSSPTVVLEGRKPEVQEAHRSHQNHVHACV